MMCDDPETFSSLGHALDVHVERVDAFLASLLAPTAAEAAYIAAAEIAFDLRHSVGHRGSPA